MAVKQLGLELYKCIRVFCLTQMAWLDFSPNSYAAIGNWTSLHIFEGQDAFQTELPWPRLECTNLVEPPNGKVVKLVLCHIYKTCRWGRREACQAGNPLAWAGDWKSSKGKTIRREQQRKWIQSSWSSETCFQFAQHGIVFFLSQKYHLIECHWW